MRLLLLLLGLMLLANASCIDNATDIIMSEQGSLITTVMMLTVIAIAIGYMAGQTLQRPELIVHSKDEFHHLIFSVVLLLGIGGVLALGCAISESVMQFGHSNLNMQTTCYAPGQSAIATANCYIGNLESEVDKFIYFSTDAQVKYLQDAGWAYTAGDLLGGNIMTTSMEGYKRVYANQFDIVTSTFLVPTRVAISMQKILLKVIDEAFIAYLLPIAFVLRFFPVMRDSGNLFIGLVVAFYVLFPLFLVFNFFMYDSVFDDCPKYKALFEDKVMDSALGLETCTSGTSLWFIARVIPIAFFLPNLSIALTVTFIAGIAKALKVVG